MQYLLTRDEMENLVDRKRFDEARKAIDEMRVMLVGNNCIYSEKRHTVYCDDCPLGTHVMSQIMCPLDKEWSK